VSAGEHDAPGERRRPEAAGEALPPAKGTGAGDDAGRFLSSAHAADDAIDRPWDQDNQQWWNWYMSLAAPEELRSQPAPGAASTLPPVAPGDAPLASDEVAATLDLADVPPAGQEALEAELAEPYPVPQEAVARFRRDGYVKLKDVVSPRALARLRRVMSARLEEALGDQHGLSFRSGEMLWLRDPVFRAFVLSPRLGGMAADLLGVDAVRLYHDNALSKEPGCGRTPWHYDADHFPIATPHICTIWIPLQPVPRAMGPLAFAVGMDRWELARDVHFGKKDTSYDAEVGHRFRSHGVEVDDGPFDLGEVSFHHALSFHTAASNRTGVPRMVLATTYFEDGARVVDRPTMVSGDWQKFMPGVGPGERIDSAYNPVCGRRSRL